VTAEAEPAAAVAVCYGRGVLELARGQDRDALDAFRAAEKMAGRLDTSNPVNPEARTLQMLALVRISDVEAAEEALGGLDERAAGTRRRARRHGRSAARPG
jgi:LuxR family transcriptional regulator, maltose regulon positive regulatory protein